MRKVDSDMDTNFSKLGHKLEHGIEEHMLVESLRMVYSEGSEC